MPLKTVAGVNSIDLIQKFHQRHSFSPPFLFIYGGAFFA